MQLAVQGRCLYRYLGTVKESNGRGKSALLPVYPCPGACPVSLSVDTLCLSRRTRVRSRLTGTLHSFQLSWLLGNFDPSVCVVTRPKNLGREGVH